VQHSSWADRLEFVGDDDRLVGFAGALPVRLLAERAGLRAGLSAAMSRRGFVPVYDRGQLLVDLAVTQILVGEAIRQRLASGTIIRGPTDLTKGALP
jgi:hypothetical protein